MGDPHELVADDAMARRGHEACPHRGQRRVYRGKSTAIISVLSIGHSQVNPVQALRYGEQTGESGGIDRGTNHGRRPAANGKWQNPAILSTRADPRDVNRNVTYPTYRNSLSFPRKNALLRASGSVLEKIHDITADGLSNTWASDNKDMRISHPCKLCMKLSTSTISMSSSSSDSSSMATGAGSGSCRS